MFLRVQQFTIYVTRTKKKEFSKVTHYSKEWLLHSSWTKVMVHFLLEWEVFLGPEKPLRTVHLCSHLALKASVKWTCKYKFIVGFKLLFGSYVIAESVLWAPWLKKVYYSCKSQMTRFFSIWKTLGNLGHTDWIQSYYHLKVLFAFAQV